MGVTSPLQKRPIVAYQPMSITPTHACFVCPCLTRVLKQKLMINVILVTPCISMHLDDLAR